MNQLNYFTFFLILLSMNCFAFTDYKISELQGSHLEALGKSIALQLRDKEEVIQINKNNKVVFQSSKFNSESRNWNINQCSLETVEDAKDRFGIEEISGYSFGKCTAFLVASNKLVTAGHCLFSNWWTRFDEKQEEKEQACAASRWIFNYSSNNYKSAKNDQIEVNRDDIYECEKVEGAFEKSKGIDWAIVTLKRHVRDGIPLSLNTAPLDPNQRLFSIGHPRGMALKLFEGLVYANKSDEFGFQMINPIVYPGQSGSPILNQNNEVVGIATAMLGTRGWETAPRYENEPRCNKIPKFEIFPKDEAIKMLELNFAKTYLFLSNKHYNIQANLEWLYPRILKLFEKEDYLLVRNEDDNLTLAFMPSSKNQMKIDRFLLNRKIPNKRNFSPISVFTASKIDKAIELLEDL